MGTTQLGFLEAQGFKCCFLRPARLVWSSTWSSQVKGQPMPISLQCPHIRKSFMSEQGG